MNKISDLDDAALEWLFDTLEKHPEQNDEVKRMMHDLFVHQVELEQQNRELQEMQEKLEESRDRYADLYDFAPVAYVTLDSTGSVQEINLSGAELLGKERQDLIGVSLAGFAEPGNRRVVLSFLRRLSESDSPCTEVFSLTSADGRKKVVRAQGQAEPSARLCYVALLDITAAREAEFALAQSKDNYRALEAGSTDLISCHEPSGAFIYVSPSCRKMLGYEPEEVIGRSVFELFHPEDLDAIHVSFANVLSATPTGAVQCRIRRKEGDYTWFEIKNKGVEADANGRSVFIIVEYRRISEHEPVER